jgi:phospholipase A1/A2
MKKKRACFILVAVVFFFSPVPASAGRSDCLKTQISATSFEIQTYKPLYFIESYDGDLTRRGTGIETSEVKFQYSFKFPFHVDRLHEFSFGYTQVSYWQLTNTSNSSPFRESNYAPEFFYIVRHETAAFGLDNVESTLGFKHESNGKGGAESRSWNRLYGQVRLDWPRLAIDIRPWYRIPERIKNSPSDTRGDDNPDILRYLGYGELSAGYRYGRVNAVLTGRDNLRWRRNFGAVQFDLMYAVDGQLTLYFQYFSGYGESLIDYNRYNERIGGGIMFASW